MTSQPQTVTIAQALASTSSGLLVADTAAHIVAALPNAALTARIASFTIAAPAALTAAQISLLFPLAAKLHAPAGFLALSGANICTVAQLGAYEALPGFTVAPGGSITLSDSTTAIVGMLNAHPIWFAQVAAVTIHLDGTTIGAYPASQINGFIVHGKPVTFVPVGNNTTLHIGAAAHDLATNAPSLNALAAHVNLTITVTNDGAGISAVDAISLVGLQGFHPANHTLFVTDTAANIGAHLSALLGQGYAQIQVASGTLAGTAAQLTDPTIHFASGAHAQLSASATVGASTAAALAALPGYSAAPGASLSVSDTAANLLSNSAAWLSVAGAVGLSADATVSAAAAQALGQLTHFSVSGHSLTVADTLPAIEALPPSTASLATGFALTADAIVSAAQFSNLPAINSFNLAGHTITISDTAPALLGLSGSNLSRAASVTLSGDATVTVAQMHLLAAEPDFNSAGHNLVVADQAASLSTLTHAETALASSIQVSGDATVNALQFAYLSTLQNLSLNGHPLTVIDTAANLTGLTTHLALIGATSLSADATVTAAAFTALSALPQFTNNGHILAIADTAGSLLSLTGSNLSQVTSTILSADATLSAQQAETLASEPGFATGGHQLVVSDTASNLLTLPPALLVSASSLTLSGNQTVSAPILTQLAALGSKFSEGGHTLSVSDTAPALLALSSSDLARASTVSLSADATVTTAQLQALAAEPGFNTAGHALTVADTAANLTAIPQAALPFASALELSADATLSAAAAQALTAKTGYTADSHTLTISDSAAMLAGLTAPVVAFATAEQVNVSATISAATANALAGLPHLVEAAGVALTIQDTMAGLLGLSAPAIAVASTLHLLPGSIVDTDVAHAAALSALPGFSASGSTITVTDTLADLAAPQTAGWSSVSTAHAVVDSAAAIVAASGSMLLTTATSVALSAPSTISAAAATTLSGLPNFISAAQVTVADTTAALIANAPALTSLHSAVSVTDSATITVAGASTLAQIQAASAHFSMGSQSLTISDSAANLTSLTYAESALASAFALSSDGTVNVPQFAYLSSLPNMSLGSHMLTVSDTAASLAAISGHFALISASSLSADATVSAATLNTLSSLPHFTNGGHALIVADNATNLLGLIGANLSQVSSTILSANALVNASQAQALSAEPGFSTGGHQLVIIDSAANLLALPHALQVASSEMTLSGDQTVSASTLTQLATLGLKFNEAGHTLTCVDTAGNLATLTPSAITLAGGEILGSSAVVSATTAAALAALPSLTAQAGVVLSVQDSVANLITLGQGVPAIVTSETLAPGSTVTINASQASALSNIPRFSANSATITVADTVANLNTAGSTVLQAIASSTDVIDSAANLASNSSSPLLQNATSVTLSGNAQVTAAVATQLATIPHFSAVPYQLTVADTAANTAQHVGSIVTLGANALITDSGPVTAAVADRLAILSTAGTLSFQGGNQLLVQDNFASLVSQTNAAGLALAARLGVLDSATNLVSALSHNWGALNPSYTLSQGGVISASTATSLFSLGSHFSSGGYAFSVSDNAANVVGAAAALSGLQIRATVSDTASNIGAQASNLVSEGSAIFHVNFTDSSPVSAITAGHLASLATLISGPPLLVNDTAANVDAQFSQMQALGSHVVISVQDSASNVASHATDLAILGSAVTVALTDSLPVTASVAAGLAPLTSLLAPGTQLAIADTGSNIAANATSLSALSAAIGGLALTDGYTLSAANAAAIAPLDSHLNPAVTFTVTGVAAAITAAQDGLLKLLGDGHLAAVNVSGDTVADVITHAAAIAALSANVTITDTAANVDASLAALTQLGHLQSIGLTDIGTPALSMSVATLNSNAGTVMKIATSFTLTVSDSAANISADLARGASSVILANMAHIGSLMANDGGTVVLTQDQALSPGVNDGQNSALAAFSGSLELTQVTVSHVNMVVAGTHTPSRVDLADSATNVSSDLALGSSSVLLSNNNLLHRVDLTSGLSITLTQQQALEAGVDDSAQSIFAKTVGAQLVITAATVAGLPLLTSLFQTPSAISISDTAAHLSADLAASNSALVAILPTITAVSVSDNQPISLTETQILASHIDDGASSVLAKVNGLQLDVTQVAASDLTTILGLPVTPTQVGLSDTAGEIVDNIAAILTNIAYISTIDVTDGMPLSLTALQALTPHVADGPGSIIGRLTGHAYQVSGSTVAELPALAAVLDSPTSLTVNDTSTAIVADLTSGQSVLATSIIPVSAVNVVGDIMSLSDSQANTIIGSQLLQNVVNLLAPASQVVITNAPISDIAAFATAGFPHLSINVADTVADIAADLSSNSSVLMNNSPICSSVVLTGGGAVNASTLTGMSLLHGFSTNGYSLTLQDDAASVLTLSPAALALAHSILVSDSDTNLAASLDGLQNALHGQLVINIITNSPSITVTAAQYASDKPTIDAVTNPAVFQVTGSTADLLNLTGALALDNAVGQVTVTDTAANVVSNLSALQHSGSKLYVHLTDTSITANLVPSLLGIFNLTPPGIQVVDTGTQIAALLEAGLTGVTSYLQTYGVKLSADSAVTAADAAALETVNNLNKDGHSLVIWDTAQHLASATYGAVISAANIDAVYLRAPGNAVTVNATQAAALFALSHFSVTNPDGSTNALSVSDSASHIEQTIAVLTANATHITAVKVSTNAIINDQALSDLQSINATAAIGANLTVQDTAMAIASNASSQTGSLVTITPSAWTLSGNATISETSAVILGALPNFSPGVFRISLGLTNDLSISVSDANMLGNIGSALDLGGYHLVVGGPVAQLAGLSTAALALTTPAVSDSVANVSALSQSSPLLQGSVEITGSDALNAISGAALFNLIRSGGGGPGIAPNTLSFDSIHLLSDTVTNLRQLTSSSGWTNSSSVHGSLHLIAADSVTNLVNAANTSYLSGTYESTLTGDATTSASIAASLNAIASTIHFNRESYHITVQDTAANLIDPANAGAVSLADNVLLTGPDTVSAADAETLLTLNHFHLTTALTIEDSSSALLDNPIMLEQAITANGASSHITVQLAGPETLDAETAESLTTLTGFTGGNNLTVADDPSYLLNSANLSAEEMAVQVTLSSDETVSASTILRLSELPHFNCGSFHLALASNDYADFATLKAVADLGAAFQPSGHSLTMTADALSLTPTEYSALQADNVNVNGHALGILPTGVSVTDAGDHLTIAGHGLSGNLLKVYAADASVVFSSTSPSESFAVTTPDAAPGGNFSLTSTIPSSGTEGAPVIVLDAALVEGSVAAAGLTFAATGQVQVDVGKFLNIYTAGSVPGSTNPALVYDPAAHTVMLELPGHMTTPLVTLGGTTHPDALTASEFLFKTHG